MENPKAEEERRFISMQDAEDCFQHSGNNLAKDSIEDYDYELSVCFTSLSHRSTNRRYTLCGFRRRRFRKKWCQFLGEDGALESFELGLFGEEEDEWPEGGEDKHLR